MNAKILKTVSHVISILFLGIVLTPVVFAVDCDKDGDGFITISYNQMQEVVLDNLEYKPNGNYTKEEWDNLYNEYKIGLSSNPELNNIYVCDNINFKAGAEPERCDNLVIEPNSGVYDSSKVQSVTGKKVNPGSFDLADNGIDENCDGKDDSFIQKGSIGDEKDLTSLSGKIIALLSKIVVLASIAVLLWGGILYATAAGNEDKTSKARKAIIGAVIGLIVGLLAPTVVNFIVANT